MAQYVNLYADIFREFLEQKASPDNNIVGDFPICWFGDFFTAKPNILTISMRPDPYEYNHNRFPKAPMSFREAYDNYFRENPNQIYFGWKGGNCLWEGLVNQLGASFYDYDSDKYPFQAVHTTIFPFISDLGKASESSLKRLKNQICRSAFAVTTHDCFSYLEENRFFEKESVHTLKSFNTGDCSYIYPIKVVEVEGTRVFSIPNYIDIQMESSSIESIHQLYTLFKELIPTDSVKLAAIFEKCGINVTLGRPDDAEDKDAVTLPDYKTIVELYYPKGPEDPENNCAIPYPSGEWEGWLHIPYIINGGIEKLLETLKKETKSRGLSEISFSVLSSEDDVDDVFIQEVDDDDEFHPDDDAI